MEDKSIFGRVVEKAINNGWDKKCWPILEFTNSYGLVDGIKLTDERDNTPIYLSIMEVIFDHDFAKAFWGDEPICDYCGESKFNPGESFDGEIVTYDPHCKNCGCPAMDIIEFGKMDGTTLPAYFYHLQQMILERDFIKYLEKFL